MQYNIENKSFLMSALFGVIIGFASLLLLTLLSAFILTALKVSGSASGVIAVIILGVSSLISGYFSARKLNSKVLIIGAAAGTLFYLTVAVISAAVTKQGFSSVFLLRMLICFLTSEVGAFLSTIKRNKSKYI